MYIINRQYMAVEFPLLNGSSIILNGANIQAVQLGLGDAYGMTYVQDAVFDEINSIYSNIINQGYIFVDKKEKSAKAKYQETKDIEMPTDPINPEKKAY